MYVPIYIICVKRNKNFYVYVTSTQLSGLFIFLESYIYETKMCEISSLCKNSITASKASMQNSVDDGAAHCAAR